MAGAARPLTVLLAGDVMTGRGVDQILAHPSRPSLHEPYIRDARAYATLAEAKHGVIDAPVDPAYIWGDGLSVLQAEKPQASLVNLETSITVSDAFWPDKAVHYRMHPKNIGCLTAAGIDVCTLANNHVLDFDRPGLRETLDTLQTAGIQLAGAGQDLPHACQPARVPLGEDTALCVFAMGCASSGIPAAWAASDTRSGVHFLDDLSESTATRVSELVRSQTRAGDLVVASIHWGSNWDFEVSAQEVAFARRLIDAGVDLVHGHSSHHVRPIEVWHDRLILYGCGDLLTDYEGIGGHETWRGDIGAMYFVTLAHDGRLLDLRLVPTRMLRLRLTRAQGADDQWLEETLNRISRPFGTQVERTKGGVRLMSGSTS